MTVETFKTGRNKRLHSGGNKDWLFASFAALIDECKSSNCRTTLQCVHCHHCSGEVLMVTWCMHTHYLSTLWYNFTTITQNIPGLLCVKRLGADWRADAAITANESCEDAAPDNWTFMELGHKNCRDYWWWWLGTRAANEPSRSLKFNNHRESPLKPPIPYDLCVGNPIWNIYLLWVEAHLA